jgi:putative DNA primase/helicase
MSIIGPEHAPIQAEQPPEPRVVTLQAERGAEEPHGHQALSAHPTIPVVPTQLTERNQWVLWRYEGRNGKATKVPYQVSGRRAKADEPETWNTFEAVNCVWTEKPDRYDGIGFVFSESDPYVGIDLDNCLDESGNPKTWVRALIERFSDTYHEISPSGRGLKIWAGGMLNGPGRRVPYHDGWIEAYDRGRFFTVTGRRLAPSTPLRIEEHQLEISKLYSLIAAGRLKKVQE